MARYIDADKMQDFIVETNDIDDWCVSQYSADWISSFIESQPTADVVEVVRCKDCIYWDKRTVNNKGFIICAASGMEIHTEDFCSYGERKGNDAK